MNIGDEMPCVVTIVREFDEDKDEWQGQKLANPFRNKWWGKLAQDGSEVLICVHNGIESESIKATRGAIVTLIKNIC